MILFPILFTYIFIEGLSIFSKNLLNILKIILNIQNMIRQVIQIYHFLLKLILQIYLLFNLLYLKDWSVKIRCFTILEFTNIVSTLFYNFIEFIILLYTYLVFSFARYKEYIICLISFSKFSDVLPAFICESTIDILCNIYLGLNTLRFE